MSTPLTPGSPDWLRLMAACEVRCTDHEDAASLEAAADRIERLERENAALREEIKDARTKALSVALEAYTRDLQDLKAENAALRKGLDDAATSLCTISQQAGRTNELSEMSEIRGYAFSRYSAAIGAARKEDTQP